MKKVPMFISIFEWNWKDFGIGFNVYENGAYLQDHKVSASVWIGFLSIWVSMWRKSKTFKA